MKNEIITQVAAMLAAHQWVSTGLSYGSPDGCSCGARTRPLPGDSDVLERRAAAFAEHQTAMLLPLLGSVTAK